MADNKIAELYVEIKVKTDQLEKDLNALKATTEKTTTSIGKATTGFGRGTQNLGKFTSGLVNAAGVTGKLGNLLGNLGSGLLTGGLIGAGFAAGAAALSYLTEKAQQFTKSIQDAITKLIAFKDPFKDIKFTIDPAQLDQVISATEQSISSVEGRVNAIVKATGAVVYGVNTLAVAEEILQGVFDKSIVLTDEELKRLKTDKLILESLEQQKASYEAQKLVAERLAKIGVTQSTSIDEIKNKLEESKKKQEEYANALKKSTKGTDEYKAIQTALNNEIDNYNALIGIAKEKTEKVLTPLEETKKRLQALRDELTKLRAEKFTWEEIFGMKKPFQVGTVAVPDMEQFELTFTIAEERILAFNEAVLQSQITLGDALFAGATSMADGINAAFDSMWSGIKLSAEEAKNPLANFFVTMANAFIAQVQRMIAQWLAFKALLLIGDIFTGGGVSALATAAGGGKHGGAWQNGKQVQKFARGGDFMVPSGFPNDSYGLRVQSGERVTVTPSSRVGEESKLLSMVIGRLDALNKNLVTKNMSPIVNVDIDGKKLVKQVTSPNENKLRKAGVDLTSL